MYPKIGDMYICHYKSGGGTEYEEGIFKVIKITKKAMTLEMIKEGFFGQYKDMKIRRIPTLEGKRTAFCPAVYWDDDDSVTVYHEGRGIPFTYEKIVPTFSQLRAEIHLAP